MRQTVKETPKNAAKLQVTTASDREIAMTRVFDAPRSLVFDAFTKPELLKRWLGGGNDRSNANRGCGSIRNDEPI
jgi:hypothetical protein